MTEMEEATRVQDVESSVQKLKRRMDEARTRKDAELAAQKAQRLKQAVSDSSDPSPLPALQRPVPEIETLSSNNAIISESCKSPISGATAPSPTKMKPLSIARSLDDPIASLISRRVEPEVNHQPRSRILRSPSAIPEKPPYHHMQETAHLGVEPTEMAKYVPYLVPPSETVQDASQSADCNSTPTEACHRFSTLHIQNMGIVEYVVPLSMPPRAQKQYIDTYRYYWKRIERFVQRKESTRQLLDDMNLMCDRVAMATTHMDLEGGGPSSQDEVDPEEEASYAESCSEKFVFLGKLLQCIRHDDIHLAIVARPGQLMDFIETFLRARKMHYARPDTMSYSDADHAQGSASVTIIASGSRSSIMPQAADLIIAFDETFSAKDTQVQALRNKITRVGPLAPVIHLVVYASLEHINLCIPTTFQPLSRLRALIFCMLHTEKYVGQLATESLKLSVYNPAKCASQIAQNIRVCRAADKLLPAMPALENIPVLESDISDTMSDASDECHSYLDNDSPLLVWPDRVPISSKAELDGRIALGDKRNWDFELGDSLDTQVKKLKVATLLDNPQIVNRSHDGRECREPRSHARVEQLEAELAVKDATIKDISHVLDAMQFTYENNRITIGGLEDRRTFLETQVKHLTGDLVAVKATLSARDEQISQMRARHIASTELPSTNDMSEPCVSSASLADMTSNHAHAEIAALEAAIIARDKSLENLQADFQFTRQQYQAASTATSVLHTELQEIQAMLPTLHRRAAGRERFTSTRQAREERLATMLRHELLRLKEQLRAAERKGRDLEEKIEKLERGRGIGVQTRGSSQQPAGGKSPRGSRGVSPALAGGLKFEGAIGINAAGGLPMGRIPSGLGKALDRS